MLSLIVSNLLRRRLRSAITALGVAVAVAALFSMLAFQQGYRRGLRGELDRLGAHILVVPKGCPYDAASIALHGASWPCYLKETYLETVRKSAHVEVAAPVHMTAVYDQKSGAQAVYCGVEPDVLALKRFWRIEGAFPERPGELLVGTEAAKERGWKTGDTIALPGLEGKTGRVSGILKPTQGADDLFIFLRLSDSQRLFNRPGEITHMLVRLDDPAKMEAAVNALRGCGAGLEMNVVPLTHLFATINSLITGTRMLLASVALVALLAAGAGVGNTILMAVIERSREIGALRAIGATRARIFGIVLAETSVLCLIGGIAGIAGAIAGSRAIETWLRGRLPFAPGGALIPWQPDVALICLAGAMAVGLVSGLLPAWRASSLPPAAAMRSQGSAA